MGVLDNISYPEPLIIKVNCMKYEKIVTAISATAVCLILPVAGTAIIFNDLKPIDSIPVIEYESVLETTVTELPVSTMSTTSTTIASTTTVVTSSTTVEQTIESITEPITESAVESIEYDSESVEDEIVEDVSEVTLEDTNSSNPESEFQGSFEATWYTAVDMGYTSTPFGYYNRDLVSGYSIASNTIPGGSLVQVVGGGLDGIYRVDDIGYMGDSVIDFYYWDRSCIPEYFRDMGRVNIEIYIIE